LLFDEKIKLKYTQNYFTIEFAAPYFSGTEKIQYRYMLEGVDKDWVDAGTRNVASYPNTGSGNFSFRVRASVDNGQWVESKMVLRIEVVPPFWKRLWFYAIIALLIGGAAFAVYGYSINELLKRQAIRNKIAQDLHDNIGSTLSSISVFSQVAKIRGERDEKEGLQELLNKISDTSNEMIMEMNDTVWAINPQNDSMEKIIQRMESYAKPLLAVRNIQFSYHYDKSILNLHLEMERRKNFYLVFKEAVNNAIKYSGASELNVTITQQNNLLELIVKDNGVGFNVEKELNEASQSLSGNGLRNMKARAKDMQAQITIESTPGIGTSINLRCSYS
jgi:signal transduction histidine kinase